MAWLGVADQGRRGSAWRGQAWRGEVRQARQGGAGLGLADQGRQVGRGEARQVMVWRGFYS